MNKKEKNIIEKENCILMSAKLFLENDYFIKDIAMILGKSTSTIQRYLNDPYIEFELGSDIKLKIKEKLQSKKEEGNLLGGIISTINNESLKDREGKFTGMKRR